MGGNMRRLDFRSIWLPLILLIGGVEAQAQFSIRAASAEPIEGWQRMQFENGGRAIWVSPTAAISAEDIERAQPETQNGETKIAIIFTESGARKIRDLSIAQKDKLVALVVGSRLIWAPTVKSEIGKRSVLTGNGPNGLAPEEVALIMSSLR